MTDDERAAEYRNLLKFADAATGPTVEDTAQYRALQRAHDLRRFEIENYWRRSTYFWGFQLAALAALAIARQSNALDGIILMAVAIFGMTTALTGVLTAKGSKFWQQNWEAHVDFLEDEIEGRLHKVALSRDENLAPSVSRANERLLWALTIGWILIFITGAIYYAELCPSAPLSWIKVAVILAMSAAAVGVFLWMWFTPKSDLKQRAYDLRTMTEIQVRARTG